MRTILLTLALGFVAACGDDGSTNSKVDAPMGGADAPSNVDAPPAATGGLGQKCGGTEPACPASAPECVGIAGATGRGQFCTPKCLAGGTGTTNASGQFTATTPSPDPAKCTAAFSGSVGMPVCGLILAYTPMDNPLKANTAYTGIDLGCVIVCGTGMTCPTGTLATTLGSNCACLPAM
ncbi:MAG: hypothetical protein NT062_33170 [Proteobacteria bacterium]|nr:hypothetical protein [Pseudomonadota bacterium]